MLQIRLWVISYEVSGLVAAKLSWVDPTSFVAMEYGSVTMIVPAFGQQVRCIPWMQMGIFNEEIGFLCGLKFFALNIF